MTDDRSRIEHQSIANRDYTTLAIRDSRSLIIPPRPETHIVPWNALITPAPVISLTRTHQI